MRNMADDLVSTGLAGLGYQYLAVDGQPHFQHALCMCIDEHMTA